MKVGEVREKYLEFMRSKGHVIVPGASLVPENDPTTLFTGSGMQPMIPYLLGQTHPLGTRIADSQRSFRSEDIEEVGDNRHTTFFEMLGNWSFGDYFRREQIGWISEFLFQHIWIDPNKFYVTVFQGDDENNLPRDTESAELWKEIFKAQGIEAKVVDMGTEEEAARKGMQGGRIFYYSAKKNWWSRAGAPSKMPLGEPGGPDTEMFYEFTDIAHDPRYGTHCHPNCDCGRFMEIGNNVFMTYKKVGERQFELLPRQNVDFGGGLERQAAAANNDPDVFNLDIFAPFRDRLERASGKKYTKGNLSGPERLPFVKSFRIVMDHVRAAHALIEDGVRPSNTEHGYVLRRLLRRAIVHADKLGIAPGSLFEDEVAYEEETKFRKTLERGLREFEKGERDAFTLFTSFGFPFELTQELMAEKGERVDEEEFKKMMSRHSELSRSASEGKFKGGLADTSDMSVKYHTGTHLLQQALRTVLGNHVYQKGSNITPLRLRFDFSHSAKMTTEEIKKVEDLVNEKINEALPVSYRDLPLEEAKKLGAIGLFEENYGDVVRVYQIGEGDSKFSLEFCGGPHVENTSELGSPSIPLGTPRRFKIVREEAVSSGVRRIKAVLE
jgi:alanyl-tRNA synthetase